MKVLVAHIGDLNANGFRLAAGSVKTVSSIPVTRGFDPKQVIGRADITTEEEKVYGHVWLMPGHDISGMYSSLGFIAQRAEDGVITDAQPTELSFYLGPNADPSIPPIGEVVDGLMPVTEQSLSVVRPRGRPRAKEACTSVSAWVPATYHDRLIRLAKDQEVSVSAVVRQLLVLQLRNG